MTWRLVGGGTALLVSLVALVGWLTIEGDERRRYGWVTVFALLTTYGVTPWAYLQQVWK